RAWDLEHMYALQSAAAVEFQKSAFNPHTFPPPERQIANIVEADGATVNGEILLRHVRLIRRCLSDPAFRTDKVLLHFQSSPLSESFRSSLSARIQIDRQYMRIKVPLA